MDFTDIDNVFGNETKGIDDMSGVPMTGDEMEKQNIVNDPVLNMLNNSTTIVPDKWTPNMESITEETVFDLANSNGEICVIPPISSGKRRRAMIYKQMKDTASYENKISRAVGNKGIYRVQIKSAQNDGGANRLVTSSKSLLVHYEDIPGYGISDVKEGEAAIVCTGKGYLPW